MMQSLPRIYVDGLYVILFFMFTKEEIADAHFQDAETEGHP